VTKENRPAVTGRINTTNTVIVTDADDIATTTSLCVSSQQVSWWSVHEHVGPFLDAAGSWPMVGTPAWCELADDDPAKLAALFDAAQHWALRVETCQQTQADASRDISAAADWSVIAGEMYQRAAFYAERPYLKRRAS
jgi:Protein of unknown function (DUF2742)